MVMQTIWNKIEAIVPDDEDIPFTLIQFQNGARKDPAKSLIQNRLKGFPEW